MKTISFLKNPTATILNVNNYLRKELNRFKSFENYRQKNILYCIMHRQYKTNNKYIFKVNNEILK